MELILCTNILTSLNNLQRLIVQSIAHTVIKVVYGSTASILGSQTGKEKVAITSTLFLSLAFSVQPAQGLALDYQAVSLHAAGTSGKLSKPYLS